MSIYLEILSIVCPRAPQNKQKITILWAVKGRLTTFKNASNLVGPDFAMYTIVIITFIPET